VIFLLLISHQVAWQQEQQMFSLLISYSLYITKLAPRHQPTRLNSSLSLKILSYLSGSSSMHISTFRAMVSIDALQICTNLTLEWTNLKCLTSPSAFMSSYCSCCKILSLCCLFLLADVTEDKNMEIWDWTPWLQGSRENQGTPH
jgi:hypothetical protein